MRVEWLGELELQAESLSLSGGFLGWGRAVRSWSGLPNKL